MSIVKLFNKFWNDPVWSKVIAAGIIAGLSFLSLTISGTFVYVLPFLKYATIAIIGIIFLLGLYIVFRLYHRQRAKTLVFISSGGTCRDPMAKAILIKLLEKRKLKYPLHIEAAALGPLSKSEISYAARYVIKEMYKKDLLASYKPKILTPELVKQADLLFVMSKSLLMTPGKTLPSEKTYVLKDFFGLGGDIIDPWPDGKDYATLSRYRKCAEELKAILSNNLNHLICVLGL